IRVLHDVRIRAPHVHEARPQNCRHRAAVSSQLIADNTHLITHALILAAGLGTRLRPLTDARPKPAMPVAGEPLIRRITTWLASGGVSEMVVNLHHRPEPRTAVLGDGCDLGVRVRYSWEQPRVLGSAGGPRLALPLLDVDAFLLVNGDTLTDVDLAAL